MPIASTIRVRAEAYRFCQSLDQLEELAGEVESDAGGQYELRKVVKNWSSDDYPHSGQSANLQSFRSGFLEISASKKKNPTHRCQLDQFQISKQCSRSGAEQ